MAARVQWVGDLQQYVLLWRGWKFVGHPGHIWMYYRSSRTSRETSVFHRLPFNDHREFAERCMDCLERAPMLHWHPIEGPELIHKISNPDAYAAAYDAWKVAQCR